MARGARRVESAGRGPGRMAVIRPPRRGEWMSIRLHDGPPPSSPARPA